MTLDFAPLSAEDLPLMTHLWADPAVIRYTSVERPCTSQQARLRFDALLDAQRRAGRGTLFRVICSGTPCGVVGCVQLGRDGRRFAMFYQFDPAFWGKGIGKAAVGWLVRRMRSGWPRAVLEAEVVRENTASVRILEGAGFVLSGVRPAVFVRNGAASDLLCYRLAF